MAGPELVNDSHGQGWLAFGGSVAGGGDGGPAHNIGPLMRKNRVESEVSQG